MTNSGSARLSMLPNGWNVWVKEISRRSDPTGGVHLKCHPGWRSQPDPASGFTTAVGRDNQGRLHLDDGTAVISNSIPLGGPSISGSEVT